MTTPARAHACALGLALLALLASACTATATPRRGDAAKNRRPAFGSSVSPQGAHDAAIDLRYEISVDASLSTMHARLCVHGAPPGELVCGLHGGASAIEAAWAETPTAPRPLPIERNAIVAEGVPADGCLGYRLDLARAAAVGGLDAVRRDGVLVMNTALWLLRPRRFDAVRSIRVELTLPEGVRAELPWPVDGDALAPDLTALAYYGHVVLGRFDTERFDEAGARFDVVIPEGLSATTRAAIVPWLRTAASASARVTGRVPAARVLVIIVPDEPGERPVRFGTVARGGGASLLLFVPRDAALEALRSDWVAVHELSHLLHPFVERKDAWLPEGFATYYQELLRVRAGLMPEPEAWQRIAAGAQRGAAATHSLAQESADMFLTFEFSRVYWGGAAFALLADVELRKRSGGTRTLDSVLTQIHECCSRSARPWPARELLARMDELAGAPVFSELAERNVYRPGFPDVTPVLKELGVMVSEAGVQLDASAPAAAMRAAIMLPVAGPAKSAQEDQNRLLLSPRLPASL